MSTIEERVKKIIIEQLGVKEEEVKNAASFVEDLVLILLTPLNWLWLWKKSLILRFQTKKQRRLLLFKQRLIISLLLTRNRTYLGGHSTA